MTSTLTAEQNELLDLPDRVHDLEQENARLRAELDNAPPRPRAAAKLPVLPAAWGMYPVEQTILIMLARNAGKPIGRERMFEMLKSAGALRSDALQTLSVHMSRMKKKAGQLTPPITVNCRLGVGYQIGTADAGLVLAAIVDGGLR